MITNYKFFSDKSNIFLDKIINRSKLDNTLNEDSFKDETNIAFRTILKNNGENKYLLIDQENTIKAFFNLKIKDYLDKHIDLFLSNEDIAVFVTKSNFDVLFTKAENEINTNVVLVINEFEFIFNEILKNTSDKTYEDINLNNDIKEKTTKIKQSINSLDKKFNTEENNLFLSDIKFTEIFDLCDYLIEKKKTLTSIPPLDTNLDFKALFFAQPSQQKKTKKDFSDYSRIDMSFLNKKRNKEESEKKNDEKNEENKKEEEDKKKEDKNEEGKKEEEKQEKSKEDVKKNNENDLPTEIKNLIEKNKDKILKADTFEEYKNYRKLNIKWD